MTISLWGTYAQVQAVEAHAAQARRAAGSAMHVATADVAIYVLDADLAAVPGSRLTTSVVHAARTPRRRCCERIDGRVGQ